VRSGAGERLDRGIEPLQVANLQNERLARRQLHELPGFLDGLGDRFLHQHVHASLEAFTCNRMVQRGRRRDADGVDRVEDVPELGGCATTSLRRHPLARGGVRVYDRDQFRAWQCGVLLGVKSSQVSDADDGGANVLHGRDDT